jgi:hypothetical protein
LIQHPARDCGGEQDEAELAPLGQRQAEAQRALGRAALDEPHAEGDGHLHCDHHRDEAGHQSGTERREPEIGRHADRDEEEAKEQSLERLNVGLNFVPVLGVRQHDAGHERAERHGQARPIGQGGGADHQQERGRGEHLRRLRPADRAEKGSDQDAAADEDGGDGADVARHVRPTRVDARPGEERHQGDQGDERHVLEQQHGKAVPPGGRGEEVPFGEHRQHDGRRGQGEAGAEHDRAGPRRAGEVREAGEQRRARHHLAEAQPEHRLAENPEPMRPEFEADQEQQHHDAEFRDRRDSRDIGDEAQPGRADHRAGDQVAKNAAEPQPARDRDGDRRRAKQGDQRLKHHMSPWSRIVQSVPHQRPDILPIIRHSRVS